MCEYCSLWDQAEEDLWNVHSMSRVCKNIVEFDSFKMAGASRLASFMVKLSVICQLIQLRPQGLFSVQNGSLETTPANSRSSEKN